MLIRILTPLIILSFATLARSQCFLVPTQVCQGDCGPLFYLQNDPPGTTYAWSISCGTITNDSMANPHVVCFTSAGICTIQVIVVIPGEDPDTCSLMVEVLPVPVSAAIASVCEGDSIKINGTYYTPGSYIDTIQGGTANGCDSLLQILVNTAPADTTLVSYLGCTGDGYEVIVGDTTYNEAHASGTEILSGADGCDSIVIVNLIYQPDASFQFIYIGCQGDSFSIVLNAVIYNESNPTGIETIPAANGCDSIVTINMTFFPHIFDTISYTGCSGDGFSLTVGDTVYNEANPVGTEILPGGCDTIITIDLQFDTITSSLLLTGNLLCVSTLGLDYTWYLCDGTALPDTTACITVNGIGCACVIVDNGICIDTICQEFEVCQQVCDIMAIETSCLGDSVLFTLATNATDSATVNWIITLDSLAGVSYNSTDSVWVVFNTPGCYSIDVTLEDLGCTTFCTDTICIGEKPLADLCCDEVACDTCVTLTVFLFGNPPLSIAISDGISIDTIRGITTSQYDYRVCQPYDITRVYTLLWVQDTFGYCDGGIINSTASVFLEETSLASITMSGDTLCAQPPGLLYNWKDCENTTNLSFDRCFIPSASGCYCVTISNLITNCVDTACVNFIISATDGSIEQDDVRMWYDSDQHSIFITSTQFQAGEFHVQLVDIQGRTIPVLQVEQVDENSIRVRLGQHIPTMVLASVYSQQFRYTRGLFIP